MSDGKALAAEEVTCLRLQSEMGSDLRTAPRLWAGRVKVGEPNGGEVGGVASMNTIACQQSYQAIFLKFLWLWLSPKPVWVNAVTNSDISMG